MTLSKPLEISFMLVMLGTTLFSGTLLALPTDRDQSVLLNADEIEFDEQSQTITYSGSVVMEQGSMRINAEKMVIHTESDKVVKIIATGSPAHYRQLPAVDQEPVVAKANRLEYQVDQATLHLINNASLVQEGTSLSGNRIDYDVKKSIVRASSDKGEGPKERVRMVIPPKSISGQE